MKPSLFVALDAESVSGGLVSGGRGGLRVHAFARAPLGAGALSPSPVEVNARRGEEVRGALAEVGDTLGRNGRRACLLLPDGVARCVIVDVPKGVEAREFARFRLSGSLPFPESEAIVDVLPLARGRSVAAAVRRQVVEGYEALLAAAGFVQDRVEVASMATVLGLHRSSGTRRGVDVVLGDAAYSLAAHEGGLLQVIRSRRRDRGEDEPERVWEEVERSASLAWGSDPGRVRLVGGGALDLVAALRRAGHPAEPGWEISRSGLPVEGAEIPWLGAAL